MICMYCNAHKGGAVNLNPSGDPFNSLNIKHLVVSDEGIRLNASDLKSFNFEVNSKAKCLMLPGYMVITNHPNKLKTLSAIEELQFRQDEIKQDFSLSITQLTQHV